MKFEAEYVVEHGFNQFTVPSFSDESDVTTYLVDMNLNVCQCIIGCNGSVCKHQYLLWSFKFASSTNFLPYIDATERQKYSYMADGVWLPLHMFEGKNSEF